MAASSVKMPIMDPISDPVQVGGVAKPALASFLEPASQQGEAGTSVLNIGGKDGGVAGGIEDGADHSGEATGEGGTAAHSESCTDRDADVDDGEKSSASHGGGTEVCNESVTADGASVGGGGGTEAATTWRDNKLGSCNSAYPEHVEVCKAGGKAGACTRTLR